MLRIADANDPPPPGEGEVECNLTATASSRVLRCRFRVEQQDFTPWGMTKGARALPLAESVCNAYIVSAKLRRASGAIYPRGLIDPLGNCPWPGPWIRSYGAHLLS